MTRSPTSTLVPAGSRGRLHHHDMGYDLRITRAIDWAANAGLEISPEEWRTAIANDPDLHADPGSGPLCARLGSKGWLDWFEGNVFTTDPDFATVNKMLELATRFSAIVQGDDGESYDSANQWTRSRAATNQLPSTRRRE